MTIDPAEFQRAHNISTRIIDNMERVVIGKTSVLRRMLAGLMSRGHILVEDVPGVGKTTIVRTLAATVGCEFRRIQFTPDLLPSDITGVSIFDQSTTEFTFQPGPIFSQIVLADEINRTSPKTQSSLLECMEEGQVTIDGTCYKLPRPFLVLATQNPIEYEGTFPLPEAQLDRFLMRLKIGYPSHAAEKTILDSQTHLHPLSKLEPVVKPEDVLLLQDIVTYVRVDESIRKYIVDIIQDTRTHSDVYLGASPRGSLSVFRMARAWALLNGRDYVVPDDVKEVVGPALSHRIILKPEAGLHGKTADTIVQDVIHQVTVPGGDND